MNEAKGSTRRYRLQAVPFSPLSPSRLRKKMRESWPHESWWRDTSFPAASFLFFLSLRSRRTFRKKKGTARSLRQQKQCRLTLSPCLYVKPLITTITAILCNLTDGQATDTAAVNKQLTTAFLWQKG